MAKLDVMPQQDIVDAYRGILDFYRWCSLVIVRSWPRGDYRYRSAAVKATQPPFKYINQAYGSLPANIIQAYSFLGQKKGLSAKDWATRLYINGAKNMTTHQLPPP